MRVNKFFVFMIGLFCIGFALAAVLVNGGGTAFSSVNESIVAVYNFSVNNTQATENISEVNVTLPGGFVFVSDTNATDVAVTAFSNTTSVLSWTNTSLILNGSLQYFWFNATSSSMAGDYNIIITVSNSTGVFETQNLSVTVNDTTAPIVTINSPSAITYTTASITLNTTINENGTCWYSFDAGTTNVSMTNVDNRTFIAALTKANASYVVNYYCNDSVGNLNSSENVSFTVAVAPTVTSSSSASASTRTYAPSASQMLEGYNVFLHKGDRTRFSIDDEIHYFKVNSISGNLVKITISSDPISLDMTVGDSEKVDLNSDGYYDLKVNLQSVSDTRSNFVLTTINELIGQEASEPISGDSASGEAIPEVVSSDTPEDVVVVNYTWLWFFLILIVVLVAAWKSGFFGGVRKKK